VLDDDQLFNQLLAPYDDSPEKSTISSPQDSHQQPFIVPQSTTTPQTILNQFNADHQYRQPTLIAPAASPLADHEHQYSNDRHQQHQNQRSYEMHQFPNGSLNEDQDAYGMREYVQNGNGPISIQPNPSQYNYSLQYASYPPQQTQAGSYLSMGQPNAMAGLNYPSYSQQHHSLTSLQTMRNSSANESHPFAGVLSRANLKITGDLMELTYNWTPEEWQSGRKLVKFWRRQHSDNTDSSDRTGEVECGFESIEQEVYQQQRLRENMTAQKDGGPKKSNSLIVSCIYWQERNEYFITSVDCIYLLEGLIGVQFTVEEKNRIRRNLEGFRPFTVSKCKPECADFFKLIMSFPHPKPRNIEKDVKVFAWKTLSNALRKIIRKYTPSYSSTVVVNLN
jgi:hypothetical protein